MPVISDKEYGRSWWDNLYSKHEHKNNEEELSTFEEARRVIGDKFIIDVGCGEGEASQFFDHYYGIDWSEIVINRAKGKFPGKFFKAMDIDDVKEKFDFALFSQVFEHLENPKEYLKKIKRVAKKVLVIIPNGDIGRVIVENDKEYIKNITEETDYHYATYTVEDIKELFPESEPYVIGNNLFFVV